MHYQQMPPRTVQINMAENEKKYKFKNTNIAGNACMKTAK